MGVRAVRESAAKRYAYAAIFAILAGLLVALGNPMDHVKADLRADTEGVRFSLEVAAQAIEKVCIQRA